MLAQSNFEELFIDRHIVLRRFKCFEVRLSDRPFDRLSLYSYYSCPENSENQFTSLHEQIIRKLLEGTSTLPTSTATSKLGLSKINKDETISNLCYLYRQCFNVCFFCNWVKVRYLSLITFNW